MAQISIINKNGLGGNNRIDAEYYKPEYLTLMKRLSRFPLIKLDNVASITDGEHGSPELDEKSGIVYLSGNNIGDNIINLDNLRYCSLELHKKNQRSSLKKGSVLLSIVGIVGKSAVVYKELTGNTDRNVATIKNIDKGYSPYFISTFLNSRYGKFQTERESTGNVQPLLNLLQVKGLKIPTITESFQKKIENFVKDALKQHEISNNMYLTAEQLLLEELGLKNLNLKHQLFYTSTLKESFQNNRIDAEFYQPKYEQIINHLSANFNTKSLGEVIPDIITGQYCEEYIDSSEGKPYIRGTDITKGSIDIEDVVFIPQEKQLPDKVAKEGDIVVTRVGSIGLSARIPKELDGGTISDNLIRLRLNENIINSYYLILFLGSQLGIDMMIRYSRGSVQQRLNQETLKEIIFPVLPMPKQLKLANQVIKSQEAKKQAKMLLKKAKQQIENLIEGK